MEEADIVVVGAGLAGLCAARDLVTAGQQVVLVEARDRVGGRTWSAPFEAAGCVVDLGAEWVDPHCHLAIMRELERYGIGLEAPEVVAKAELFSHVAASDSWQSLLRECDRIADALDVSRPDWYSQSETYDIPASLFLARQSLEPDVLDEFLAHGFALQGADPDDYSMLNLLHEFASFGGTELAFSSADYRIGGGAQSLAIAIAGVLSAVLRLNWPVSRIAHCAEGVVVEGSAGCIRARQVIIALPVNVLRHMQLDIELPAEASRVIAQGHVGRAAKGWGAASVSELVESSGWPHAVEVYSRRGCDADALCTFAVASPDHDEALRQSWLSVEQRHPEVALSDARLSHDWVTDPYSRGSWLSSAPGQMRGLHQLADMPAPCFFTGGDLSRGWYGWMEGAVTSGRDVAARMLACGDGGAGRSATA